MEWTLQGRRSSPDAVEFALELPPAAANSLTLDVPTAAAAFTEEGVVIGPTASPLHGFRRWRVELGGRNKARLKIAPGDVQQKRKSLALVRVFSTYEFSLRGVELTVKLDLETLHQARRELEIDLDPGLRLVGARFDDRPLDWSAADASEEGASEKGARVKLALPEPGVGSSGVLSLKAFAPLTLDESRRLPGLHPVDVFWQEGQAALRIPAPLVLKQLRPLLIDGRLSCRQIEAAPLAAPDEGESVVIQHYMQRAAVEVVVGERTPRLSAQSGASLQWELDEIRGTAVLDLTVDEGKLFEIEARCPKRWFIDSAATVPTDALEDWRYRPGSDDHGELRLRFANPLSSATPSRVVVQARSPRPPDDEPTRIEDLMIARIPRTFAEQRRL
ncbi:MAG: hypothetical protein N2C14_00360, partial [Planctomycetales bacterium]